MRKLRARSFLFLALLTVGLLLEFTVSFIFALPAWGTSLPDVLSEAGEANRWVAAPFSTETWIETLKASAEDLGQWQSRTYRRTSPIASVEITLMEGEGFGTQYIPVTEDVHAADDSLFPASSTYETLEIAGKYAILESEKLTGRALSVALGKNRTLLAESMSLSREELLDFTVRLIRALQVEDSGAK